jgi:hypothetical protein
MVVLQPVLAAAGEVVLLKQVEPVQPTLAAMEEKVFLTQLLALALSTVLVVVA